MIIKIKSKNESIDGHMTQVNERIDGILKFINKTADEYCEILNFSNLTSSSLHEVAAVVEEDYAEMEEMNSSIEVLFETMRNEKLVSKFGR